ncbi:hypothetical protein DY037_07865 [Apilactobacillus micheneri]|uniref:DUF1516 family protein n=1 Tax=Apilactobacillus micheneri TaxID=1899430 RepID=A0A9Q8ILC8_9LACO|nr:hypothetical protein DY121_06540 [Apilactobacillus micheneri]TPR41961.1 hypothetical protein DY123_01880 [Apilactobacillus micheneri]TPR42809.1 hypothetical protein DY130_07140 [Apilactobacillus micheneri]TPR43620.1 hypothetical protein DY128_07140 [Apilactobacillus micheneri]TPR47875.1 hypothetical protein DY037_07865 [Apilactobacillus micheneri]
MLIFLVFTIMFIYILSILIGLTRISVKRIINWLIINRILYILLFMFDGILSIRVFHNNNIESFITVILVIISSIMVEINYSNKQRSHLMTINMLLLILSILLLLTFNLIIVKK